MTDSVPDAESPSPPRRGLWAVMGQTASPEETVVGEPSVAPANDSLADEPEPAPAFEESDQSVPASGRRGLWDLMKKTAAEPSAELASDDVSESVETTKRELDEPPARPVAPRGLFSLMQRGAGETAPLGGTPRVFDGRGGDDPQTTPFAEPQGVPPDSASHPQSKIRNPKSSESPLTLTLSPEDGGEGTGEDTEDEWDSAGPDSEDSGDLAHPPSVPIDPDDLEPPRYRRATAQAAKQSWIGLVCGVAAVAASALAMLPQVWIGFPATGLGFAAIIVGYVTLTGAGRRDMAILTRAVSLVAMGLGSLGIFLGPLFFSELGRELRESTGQQATSRHLEQMGVALNRHHDQHSAFPVGGVFAREANGATKGRHGWMTFLLPFVGEQSLYHSIDQDKSYDDPANRVAMGRDVVTYFAAGGDRAKIGQGFAVSHFAGVGGEIDDATGLSHVGVFQRDEAVKKEEVTDGLANTLIVGELAGTYPPWGDPENWRTIGRGLNKDVNGFGNSTGNGATFLLGDGSVRFFSNKTDPKLLLRLSTRDGGE